VRLSLRLGLHAVLMLCLHGAASGETYVAVHQWPVERTHSVFVDHRGDVFTTNADRERLERYDPYGTMLESWSLASATSDAPQHRGHLVSAAVASDGGFYAVDSRAHRVRHYTATGTPVRDWGGLGDEPGRFCFPASIALDGQGNVYVADGWNARVQKFAPDGTFILQFVSRDPRHGLEHVTGVAVDDSGFVFVVDPARNRVLKFDAAGGLVLGWGGTGRGEGEFDQPRQIAIDVAGNVYVSDRMNHRIQKFTRAGAYLTQWGTEGPALGEVRWLDGLAVGADGLVYVTDAGRIQVFAPEGAVVGGRVAGVGASTNLR